MEVRTDSDNLDSSFSMKNVCMPDLLLASYIKIALERNDYYLPVLVFKKQALTELPIWMIEVQS